MKLYIIKLRWFVCSKEHVLSHCPMQNKSPKNPKQSEKCPDQNWNWLQLKTTKGLKFVPSLILKAKAWTCPAMPQHLLKYVDIAPRTYVSMYFMMFYI